MAILTAIKSKGARRYFYGGMDAQAGAMLRQMDQLGMSNVKMFGGDGSALPSYPSLRWRQEPRWGGLC
jgi:branched-chain amino acid transport system substrate-binding protein